MTEAVVASRGDDEIDRLLALMLSSDAGIEIPIVHRFTPGLYVREMTAPAGAIIVSKIHRTEHPYTVSSGAMLVFVGSDVAEVRAPFTGITKPGTRRVAVVLEDCVWTTYHPTTETDIDKIEEAIIEPREVPKAYFAEAKEFLARLTEGLAFRGKIGQ